MTNKRVLDKAFTSVANFGFMNYGADLASSAMASRLGNSVSEESIAAYTRARTSEMKRATVDYSYAV